MIYVDTSVLAAYYCPEQLSKKAERVLRTIVQPAISALTEVELNSAIARKIRENQLSKKDGKKIIATFRSHTAKALYRLLPLEADHYQIAGNWIAEFSTPLKTLDALHLAVASQAGLTLLTSDQQLSKAAEHFGVDINLIA